MLSKVAGVNFLRALLGKRRHQNVGRRVEVILGMAAHELAVLRERDVAFNDPRTLAHCALIRLLGMFGELQRRTTMPDREVSPAERAVLTLHQPVLERPFIHAVDQVERPRPKLDRIVIFLAVMAPIVVAAVAAVTTLDNMTNAAGRPTARRILRIASSIAGDSAPNVCGLVRRPRRLTNSPNATWPQV